MSKFAAAEDGMQDVVNAFEDQEDAQARGYGEVYTACYEYLQDHGQLELPDTECKFCGIVLDHGWDTCSDCQAEKGIKLERNRKTGESITLEEVTDG